MKAKLKVLAVVYLKYAVASFVASFATFVPGIFAAPDMQVRKALIVSAIVAAGTAVVRAVYGAVKSGELPFPRFGV